MNTTAHTPLPQLIPAHRRAAIAWIDRGESSLRDVAAQLDLAADELLDILTLPHVAAFIEVADKVLQIRRNILARYDDIDARQSLVAVAKNPDADHVTRLRAAITILQGPPPRRSPASPPGSPTVPGAPRPDRSTSAQPSPPPTTHPATSSTPTPAQPATAQPALARTGRHRAEERSLPEPAISVRARINRAAAAPIARHDRIAIQTATCIPRSASPATSGLPP